MTRSVVPELTALVGRTLGARYRILRPIGAGGMGAVFEAEQIDLARRVAVKVLVDVDDVAVARLRQEALSAGSLRSPHVVAIFDFQANPGEPPFIVMELLGGEPLSAILQRERVLEPARAVRIAIQILSALDAAHAAGITHRDIKPSNVWVARTVTGDEHVKLLDFGIAKVDASVAGVQTATGAILGTPAYLAPEQIHGLPADARTDVRAVGLVLFEMLAGSRPWSTSGPGLFMEILKRAPPSLREVASNVPPAIADVVERACAKDPPGRFPTAAAMAQALGAALPTSASMLPAGRPSATPMLDTRTAGPTATASGYPRAPLASGPPGPAPITPPTITFNPPPTITGSPPRGSGPPPGISPPTRPPPGVSGPPPGVSAPPPHFSSTPRLSGPPTPSTPIVPAPPPERSGAVIALLAIVILLLLLLVVGGAGFFLYYRAHDAPVALADSGSAPPPATTSADAAPPTTSAAPPAPAPVASPSSSELTPPAPKPPPARRPDSNRCECVGSDHRRTLLCITPIATCNCIGPNLRRLCVVPYVYPAGSTWPACPDTKSAYSRPDAKEGAACSGYDADDKTRTSPPASGTLSCDFCSGARQYPGYHGQACRGVDASGEWIDGTWRCPSSTVNTR